MTAFKKYCINKLNFKCDENFPCLPFEIGKNIYLESIIYNAENATIVTITNVLVTVNKIERNGTVTEIER